MTQLLLIQLIQHNALIMLRSNVECAFCQLIIDQEQLVSQQFIL